MTKGELRYKADCYFVHLLNKKSLLLSHILTLDDWILLLMYNSLRKGKKSDLL